MKMLKVKIGEEFRPAVQLRTLLFIYLFMLLFFIFLVIDLPVLFFAPFILKLFAHSIILVILIFTSYWITKYYNTIIYKLTGSEMVWRRGVWFRNTGIVPYNRITNIDITQGPISRRLGIASLKIQTAGYSAQRTRSAEISIEGVKEFEELRELIMKSVRNRNPVAVESYGAGPESNTLRELIKIRKLLEKRK